jgi:hypothetical protein
LRSAGNAERLDKVAALGMRRHLQLTRPAFGSIGSFWLMHVPRIR